MKKIFLLVLFILFNFCNFSASTPVAPESGQAEKMWGTFCRQVDLARLIRERGRHLVSLGAEYDIDNELYYLEYAQDQKCSGKTLTTISLCNDELIKIRIFPAPETYEPYFAGYIKTGRQIFGRGALSDGSEHFKTQISSD